MSLKKLILDGVEEANPIKDKPLTNLLEEASMSDKPTEADIAELMNITKGTPHHKTIRGLALEHDQLRTNYGNYQQNPICKTIYLWL